MAQPNAGPIVASARLETRSIQDFIRRKIEPIFVDHSLMRRMKSAGRISGNHGGKFTELRPRKRRRDIYGGSGNVLRVSFNQTNVHDIFTLPWRTYDMGEAVTQYEEMALAPQVNQYFREQVKIVRECTEDFMEAFVEKLWADGGANSTDIHGFQSWIGNSGSLISSSALVTPSDTYASKSTALGTGGSWTGDYPQGSGAREYHYWSPFLIDVNSAELGGSTMNWANQWQHAFSYGMTYLKKLQNVVPDLMMVDAEWLRLAKNSFIGQQQIDVVQTAGTKDPGITRLNYEGVELASEYGIPANTAWLIPLKKLELRHFGSQLIHMKEQFDINTAERKMLFRFFGNMVFDSPAFFAEILEVSAGS
jgi:hypothetical protein